MLASGNRFELPLRLVAAGVTVASLALLTALSAGDFGPVYAETVFCLVFAVCTGFALVARSLGPGVGGGLGVVIALSVSLVLAAGDPQPGVGHAAFTLAATIAMVLIGRAVGKDGGGDERGRQRDRARQRIVQNRAQHADAGDDSAASEFGVERTLGAVTADFCAWADSNVARQAVAGDEPAAALARFFRQTLRERLDAHEVAVFQLTPDGHKLRTLAPGPHVVAPEADSGPLGYALQSRAAFVAARRRDADPHDRAWDWTLPLRTGERWDVVVAVKSVGRPACDRPSVAHALRDLLQLCWNHLAGMQSLQRAQRTDQQSGLLSRGELMSLLADSTRTGLRRGEPTAVIAFAVEGLRRLDDQGQWALRDELVRRVGVAVRQQLHGDDLVARFTDDRFIVLLPRLDLRLGVAVAQELIGRIERDAVRSLDPNDDLHVGVRASFVSGLFKAEDAETLLAYALAQLDAARERGVAFTYEQTDSAARTTASETVTTYVDAEASA